MVKRIRKSKESHVRFLEEYTDLVTKYGLNSLDQISFLSSALIETISRQEDPIHLFRTIMHSLNESFEMFYEKRIKL